MVTHGQPTLEWIPRLVDLPALLAKRSSFLLGPARRGGAGTLHLLACVLFSLPICLAVWILPPRGLGRKSEPRPG